MRSRIWVEADLEAFHVDPVLDEGRHSHRWRVRVYYDAKPFKDGRALAAGLRETLAPWQGQDLPASCWATEDLAEVILRMLGVGQPIGIELSRDDGPGADVWL